MPIRSPPPLSRIEPLAPIASHEGLRVYLGGETEDVEMSVLVNHLMTTRRNEQAVSVAERRLLRAKLAEGQLGRQRDLKRV